MILLEMSLLALLSMVPAAALAWAVNAYLAHQGIRSPPPSRMGAWCSAPCMGRSPGRSSSSPSPCPRRIGVGLCPAAWRVWRLTPREALRRA
jgi:hypothetical protein